MHRSLKWLESRLKTELDGQNITALLHWVEVARTTPPVLFVGAGFSLNSRPKPGGKRMSSFGRLISALATDLGDGEDAHVTDAPWVAEKHRTLFGEHTYVRRIREAVPDDDVEPGEEHDALTNISWKAVLTLNYDTLLERAFKTSRVVTFQDQLVDCGRGDAPHVVHLHGHIHFPDTMVLSLEDYRKYPTKCAGFVTYTRNLLMMHPALFLGFGANDSNFVAWSGWIQDLVRTHAPPWIRLDPSGGDEGLRAYWAPRMTTYKYDPKPRADDRQFVTILDILRKGTEELTKEGQKEYIADLLERPKDTNSPEAIAAWISDAVTTVLDLHPGDGMRDGRFAQVRMDMAQGVLRALIQPDALSRLCVDIRPSLSLIHISEPTRPY